MKFYSDIDNRLTVACFNYSDRTRMQFGRVFPASIEIPYENGSFSETRRIECAHNDSSASTSRTLYIMSLARPEDPAKLASATVVLIRTNISPLKSAYLRTSPRPARE